MVTRRRGSVLASRPWPVSCGMSIGTRIDADPEQLAAVTFNADGLVAAIAQDVDTGDVLMMAWMNAETLRSTLDEGRMVYWCAQPPGAVAQGRHERRPPVRA